MKISGAYLLVGILISRSVVAEEKCWTHTWGDVNTCRSCEKYFEGEINGTQCVAGGQWYSCYGTAEACCKGASSSCLGDALESVGDPDDTGAQNHPDLPSEVPRVKFEVCRKMTTLDHSKTNKDCMLKCEEMMAASKDPLQDESFKKWCAKNDYTLSNGNARPSKCFSNWIYGYSQEQGLASYREPMYVDSPAQCQLLCQLDDDCITWMWGTNAVAQSNEGPDVPTYAKLCNLKNVDMTKIPLLMDTSEPDGKVTDFNYCNSEMVYACNHLYKCLECEGKKRCVWHSDMHVAGWKFCNPEDYCNVIDLLQPPPATEPAAPPPATEPAAPPTEPAAPPTEPAAPPTEPAAPPTEPAAPPKTNPATAPPNGGEETLPEPPAEPTVDPDEGPQEPIPPTEPQEPEVPEPPPHLVCPDGLTSPPCYPGEICSDGRKPPCHVCPDGTKPPCDPNAICPDGIHRPPCQDDQFCPDGTRPFCQWLVCPNGITRPPCPDGEVCSDGSKPPCHICPDGSKPPCNPGFICPSGQKPPCDKDQVCPDGSHPPCNHEVCPDGVSKPPCNPNQYCSDGSRPPCHVCPDGTLPPCNPLVVCEDGSYPPCLAHQTCPEGGHPPCFGSGSDCGGCHDHGNCPGHCGGCGGGCCGGSCSNVLVRIANRPKHFQMVVDN